MWEPWAYQSLVYIYVKEIIEKYGIAKEDIYSMDETGFQMGVTSTAKVVWI